MVGDLNSVPAADVTSLRAAGVELELYPREKDETDLELAVVRRAERGCLELRVAAALGGRLDQTLANLFLLELDELTGIDVRLEDGREESCSSAGEPHPPAGPATPCRCSRWKAQAQESPPRG